MIESSRRANTLAILRGARELLSDPKHWARGYSARKANGDACRSRDKEAVCWCVMGAIGKSMATVLDFDKKEDVVVQALDTLYFSEVFERNIYREYRKLVTLNDNPLTTHSDILRWLDKRISIYAEEIGNVDASNN